MTRHPVLLRAPCCVALLALGLVAGCALGGDANVEPSYDHQNRTYVPQFSPVHLASTDAVVKPFFSPDNSVQTYVDIIQSATSDLSIGTPGWSSWNGCTNWGSRQCVGCDPAKMRADTFPVFQATLNALHRGVSVRILSNNYNEPNCAGMIGPLAFLALNGADIRFYDETTFMHAKFVAADKKVAALSSVNFSHASMMKNREAGMVLSGNGADPFVREMLSIFDNDFENGLPYVVNQEYDADDLAIIQNKSEISLTMPTPFSYPGAYIARPQAVRGIKDEIVLFASPDFALETLLEDLNKTESSLDLHIYQITDDVLCSFLVDAHEAGVKVRVLVSRHIYDTYDWRAAQVCNKKLVAAGIDVQQTPSYYEYSHQKYYIRDNSVVGLSTGNWSPSDYPQEKVDDGYPAYGTQGWQRVNRDLNIRVTSDDVVAEFQNVFDGDYAQGTPYSKY